MTRLFACPVGTSPLRLLDVFVRGVGEGFALTRRASCRQVSLGPQTHDAAPALVSCPIEPFLHSGPPDTPSDWAWRTLAMTLVERGYRLDIVSHLDKTFLPTRPYRLFVGAREGFVRLAELLPAGCLKVLHLDGADALFQNLAELERLLAIKDRRAAVLMPRRYTTPTPALQHADSAIVHGSGWTLDTYRHARVPLYSVPSVSLGAHASPEHKDFEACRRRFLWLGGPGLAHKGLDRVLEAFGRVRGLELTVCGRLTNEPDFVAAYALELSGAPGIEALGWMDVTGERFAETAGRCVGLVFPTCAEGQSGEVVAGMAAGLIPIASREAGVDVSDAGIILEDCSIETVADAMQHVAGLPAAELRAMAIRAWQQTRDHHSAPVVADRYRAAVATIVEAEARSH